MQLNAFAISVIDKYPLGIGRYSTEIYNIEAYNKAIQFREGGALKIHNGFLAAGVNYGFLGLISFTLFHFSTIYYWLRYKSKSNWLWYVPVLSSLTVILFNLTQDFSFLGGQLGLILALILGTFVSVNTFSTQHENYSE
jgi:hypothetical protein